MKQIISIFIGQGGIQLGNTHHELYCIENDIDPDGYKTKEQTYNSMNYAQNVFTQETQKGKYVSRSLFIDLDPQGIDYLKQTPYKQFYDFKHMVSGQKDAQKLFSQGFYTQGNLIFEQCLEQIRQLVEKCDNIQGIQMFHSLGGGAGSGLTSLLAQQLKILYPTKNILGYSIFPQIKGSTANQEITNAILAINSLQDAFDQYFAFDNARIKNILIENAQIERPNYTDINQLISHNISPINRQFQKCDYFQDQSELYNNLIPYKTLNLLTTSSPIRNKINLCQEIIPLQQQIYYCLSESMISYSQVEGKYLSAQISFTGNMTPKEVGASLNNARLKRNVQFVDWSPTGFRNTIDYAQPGKFKNCNFGFENKKVVAALNNTSMGDFIEDYSDLYDQALIHKQKLYPYLESGMEEQEFIQAKQYIHSILGDYRECIVSQEQDEEFRQQQKKG